MFCVNRLRPPPSSTSILLSTSCSAIEPFPPLALRAAGHEPMSVGPWQLRSLTEAPMAAGVASVRSTSLMFAVRLPAALASSITDFRSSPGTLKAVLGPWLIRPSIVLRPVAQAVAVAAESLT